MDATPITPRSIGDVLAGRLRERALPLGLVLGVLAALWLSGSLAFGAAAVVVAGGVTLWAALWPSEVEPPADTREASAPSTAGDATDKSAVPVWQQMLDVLTDAALVLDGRSFVMAVNPAAATLLAARTGQYIALVNRSPGLLEAIDKAQRTGAVQAFDVHVVAPHERHLSGIVAPLTSERSGAGVPALLVLMRDRTEAEQLAQLRADFVANASHELRTPLASLKGFVETLQGAAKDDPVARQRFLGVMQAEASRMARLIDDLLSLSRIEMREHVQPSGTVDLAAVIGEAIRALEANAAAAGISIVGPRTNSATITGDRDELAEVAQNLIQNAIKYGRRGGKVEVVLDRQDDRVVMTVADDGIGIAPEHLPRLTERFYRVSTKESRERGGTGLGLAIVKHIVNRHRGDLTITSQPGQGSRFTVSLPAASAG